MSMMQFIRDHAKGWIAWVIVIIIAIPFALWGIQQYFDPSPEATVARVNGTELSLQQLQQAHARMRARLRQVLGQNFDASQLDDATLRRETLRDLIEQELLVQAGSERGLTVTDAQLAQHIQAQQIFQEGGAFSQARYEQWLRSQGHSPGSFEAELRRALLTGQLRTAVAASALVPESEVDRMLRLLSQKRTFSTLVIPAARYRDTEVSEEAVREHYESNRSEYVTPERVSIRYVPVSREAIAQSIQPTEQELRDYYQTRKSDFVVPEQRRASHILIELDEDAGEEAVAAARERLEALKRRIEAGEADFAELAREHSEDPGSAARGGDLGFFSRGTMDEALEERIFAMEPGEVAGPIRTDFGMHLVELTEVRATESQSFEEARPEVLQAYRRERAEERFFGRAEELANLAFQYPDTLTVAADTLGLEIRETGLFSREGAEQGIASNPEVVQAAFSPEVLGDGYNSEALELDDGRVVVLRVAEHRPPEQQPLAAVREQIREALRAQAAGEKAEATGEALLRKLRGGADAQALAAEQDLEWSEPAELSRERGSADAMLRRVVFSMPKPGGDAPVYEGFTNASGNFVVVALRSVVEGDPAEAPPERREAVRRTLGEAYGQRAYEAYLESLREQAEVVVYDESL